MNAPAVSRHDVDAAPMQPLPYLVTATHRETYDTTTLVLEPERSAIAHWEAGQFTMLYSFGVGEIPVSISGDPADQDRLVHTVRDVGAVSKALAQARIGGTVGVRGPFGRGWFAEGAPRSDVVIVAGGLGLAPVRPIVHAILGHRGRPGRVTLVIGVRAPADLVYTREYEPWRAGGIEVSVTVDRADEAWTGRVGLVTGPLADVQIDGARTTAFVCGPEVMMRAVAQALAARRVPEERIILSVERSMKCGFGTCGHCQLGPELICRDGPCLSYARAKPLLSVKEL